MFKLFPGEIPRTTSKPVIPVSSIETPDAHTVVIKLKHPHPAILLAMSSALLPVIPEHIYGNGQDPKSHPRNSTDVVGSGAFKVAEYKPGEHVILERNDDYFLEGQPRLDKIIIKFYKDTNSLALALDRGEVHMQPFQSNTRDSARLAKNPNLAVTADGYAAVGPISWLAFNHQHDILKDKRVRQAISFAIDRDFITRAVDRRSPLAPRQR